MRRIKNIINFFKNMKNERIHTTNVVIEIAKTLFFKGGNNRAVAVRLFNLYGSGDGFDDEFLEYAKGVGLLPSLVCKAMEVYYPCRRAAVSVLTAAGKFDFLAEKQDWEALAGVCAWKILIEYSQWDVLARFKQWDLLASYSRWDILAEYGQWNVLAEWKQWHILADNCRWLELIAAGKFKLVPGYAMLGYAFMYSRPV